MGRDGSPFSRPPPELGRGGSARSVSSLGERTFRPEKPAWGFPIPLQYNRPLGFGNLARKSARFTNIHINTFKENYNPESLSSSGPQFPSISGRGTTTQPWDKRANALLGPPKLTLLGEPEGLAGSVFWVKLGGVLSLRLWAR